MIKKTILFLMICSLTLSASGCWSYRGLNEMSIVSGVAIDKSENGDNYNLSFEVLDLASSSKQTGVKTKIVESEGKTIFDAIRNAKKRVENKLYFGNTRIAIISNKIVKEEDLSDITEFFLRGNESRETLNIIISEEKTAKEMFSKESISNPIVSFEIQKIINEDNKITASTKDNQLYKVYDILNSQGISLVLPSVHQVMNDKKSAVEVDGLAVFKDERIVGHLTPEESKYYLFATNGIKGGILTLDEKGYGADSVSLEISKNKTKLKHSYSDDKVKMVIKVETNAYLNEVTKGVEILNEQELKEIEQKAEELLAEQITYVIQKAQHEFKSDIFGFGSSIYKSDKKLWKQIGGDWDYYFQTMEVEVKPKVNISNTSSMKNS